MLIKKLSLINGGFSVRVLKCNGGSTRSVGSSCGSRWWPNWWRVTRQIDAGTWDKINTVTNVRVWGDRLLREWNRVRVRDVWVLDEHLGKKNRYEVFCVYSLLFIFSLNATVSFFSFLIYLFWQNHFKILSQIFENKVKIKFYFKFQILSQITIID